jgi:hypothetical protein
MANNEAASVRDGFSIVGAARFELTTSCSQSRRDTGLRYAPNFPSHVFDRRPSPLLSGDATPGYATPRMFTNGPNARAKNLTAYLIECQAMSEAA